VGFEPTRRLNTAYAISNPRSYITVRITTYYYYAKQCCKPLLWTAEAVH
jgi:hypothetical protein